MDYSRWAEMQHQQPNPNPSTDSYAQVYNTHQPSYSHYPYYIHQAPNPNPILSADHQTPLNHHEIPSIQYDVSSEAGLRPPGMAASSYPPNQVGYEGQASMASYGHYQPPQIGAFPATTYYQDPSAIAQVIVPQFGSDTVNYAAVVEPLSKKFIEPASSTPKGTNVLQSMRCEVCNINCNSKDVFDRHILGKKHKRNLVGQGSTRNNFTTPTAARMLNNPGRAKKKKLLGSLGKLLGGQMIMGSTALAFGEDLEIKKQRLMQGGASVDSVRVCTICNVACNSQEVFNYHIAGKKHAMQAGLIPQNGMGLLAASSPNPILWASTTFRSPGNGSFKKGPKKAKVVQSTWCEICKIDCNSKDVLDKHKFGKKHYKKLEELIKGNNGSKTAAVPAANNPVIGPKEKPGMDKGKTVGVGDPKKQAAATKSEPEEDVETKRRKLLLGGAAVEAIRVCTLCNVACNSQTVFNYHLAGTKHAAMVEKQASGTANTGPEAVTAA